MAIKANNDDVLKVLLDGLSSEKRIELFNFHESCVTPPLPEAAHRFGCGKNVSVMIDGLTSKQKLEHSMRQDGVGKTLIHHASTYDVAQALLKDIDTPELKQLYSLKDHYGLSVEEHLDALKAKKIETDASEKHAPEPDNEALSADNADEIDETTPHVEASNIPYGPITMEDTVLQSLSKPKDLENAIEGMTAEEKVALLKRPFKSSGYPVETNTFDEESSTTFFHTMATKRDNQETLKVLLDGIPAEQRMELLRIRECQGLTPLHDMAASGRAENIPVILKGLSSDQKAECLKRTYRLNGNTPIHDIKLYHTNGLETADALLEGIEPKALKGILSLKNDESITVNAYLKKIKQAEESRFASQLKEIAVYRKNYDNKRIDNLSPLLTSLDSGTKVKLLKDNPMIIHQVVVDYPWELEAVLKDLSFEQTKEIFKLRSKEADVHFAVEGQTALTRAGRNDRAMNVIFKNKTPEQKVELASLKDAEGQTVLHTASASPDKLVDELFKGLSSAQKRDLNLIRDKNGKTPAHLRRGEADPLAILLKGLKSNDKVDVLVSEDYKGQSAVSNLSNRVHHSGKSPLSIAIEGLNWDQKKRLLNANCGNTPNGQYKTFSDSVKKDPKRQEIFKKGLNSAERREFKQMMTTS